MNNIDLYQIAGMIDVSAVRTDVTIEELIRMADLAGHYCFACAYTMPCFTKELIRLMESTPAVHIGGVVSFPSGADTTSIKIKQARELIDVGCAELDMVINVGAIKSGLYPYVYNDIKAVVDAAGVIPVKTIIEIAYLTDDEISRASQIAVSAGAQYIKTGTGWASKPTTVSNVALIKEVIGDSARIKVAGGIRSLDIMLEMIDAGCCRFGISYKSALLIMRELDERLGRNQYQTSTMTEQRKGLI